MVEAVGLNSALVVKMASRKAVGGMRCRNWGFGNCWTSELLLVASGGFEPTTKGL